MNSKNTIFILDAGGTGFKFSAVQDSREIIKSFTIPSASVTLEEQLRKIISGFHETETLCGCKPTAISFCFPGPADYPNGIIGDLENLPLFRGGVALKDMLENEFQCPVFINNDGDLFAYGEALDGILPEINKLLEQQGNPKRYKNLLGVTLGTGFGGGIVIDGVLLGGDNSAGGEINRMRNSIYYNTSIEDSVTIRAVRRVYAKEAGGTQASIHTLGMNIADGDDGNKSGFDICLGGTSSADHIMLVYREKFKNNVYGDIEMMYDAGSWQTTATLQCYNSDYYSFRFAPVEHPAATVRMTVVLGMDFVTVGNGFRDVYYSAEIDVPSLTMTTMPEYYYERETKYPYGY